MPQIVLIAAGGIFVVATALAAGLLIVPRSKLPMPVRFTSGAILISAGVFAALAVHAGFLPVWLAFGVVVIGVGARQFPSLTFPPLTRMNPWFRALFLCYGFVYLICAFAPEIQADATAYHLGLVYEYARLHSFSRRVGFYELLPHGVEMLFVPAFAIGAHSAAKLVHLSFLAAATQTVRHIGCELALADTKVCCAAAIFLIAPVTAVTSTSAYTDTGLVACCCSLVYLALRWDRDPRREFLILAALNAGFCYAIKPTFWWVAAAALVFFAFRSRRMMNTAGMFSGFAALAIAPWIVRSAVLTHNPFAPFLNSWFPNRAFTPRLEAILIHSYSAFRHEFSWPRAILDYTVRGGNQGIFGPAFLLLPLALFALRTKPGRWLMAASVLLAFPVFSNTGTRFLMPSAALAAIALTSILPTPAAVGIVALQIVGCASPVVDLYDAPHDWRLHAIPWRAALRLEKEQDYLQRSIGDFANNGMIADVTPENAGIFALAAVHQAYLPREVLGYWESSLADRMLDLLLLARDSRREPASLLSWTWPAGQYRSVRVTAGSDMRVLEAQFEPGNLRAQLNRGKVLPWTFWKAGESFDLRAPPGVTGADLLIWPSPAVLTPTLAQAPSGEWLSIEDSARKNSVPVDIRRDVTAFIRRSGYHYVLVSTKASPFSAIGEDLLEHPGDWGVQPAAHNGDVWLFYISAMLN